MKKIIYLLAIAFATTFASCKKPDVKIPVQGNSNEEFSTKMGTENFAPVERCAVVAPTAQILGVIEAKINDARDTSMYQIEFSVTAGSREMCIPKTPVFVPGNNDHYVPTPGITFDLSFAIASDETRNYVDGVTGIGYLVPDAHKETIVQLDANSAKTYSGFVIAPGKTAKFRFTGKIFEVSDPEAVISTYVYRLLQLPIKFRPLAGYADWTLIDMKLLANEGFSGALPQPGHN